MSDSGDVKAELMKGGIEFIKTTYDDALQPGAKEVGKALQTLGRAVNVALSPLQMFVWGWEQVAEYVADAVPQKLAQRKVSSERIKTPDPDVAVPALEALRYSKLRENYATLLATSMDIDSAHEAHPSFVEILKQLTPDEVKILEFLPRVGLHEPLVNLGYFVSADVGQFTTNRNVGTLGTDAGCEYPEALPKYVDNLCRLGLTEIPILTVLAQDWRYDRILALGIVKNGKEDVPQGSTFEVEKIVIGLTNLGSSFREACTMSPIPDRS